MSSRSNPFSNPEQVVSIVPPSPLDGGTFTEAILYHLYVALYYAEQAGAPETLTNPLKLALRYAQIFHRNTTGEGKLFSKAGRIKRSAGKE